MSLWDRLTGSDKTGNSTRVCEKGHAMDPNWETCAYCDAEKRATQRTARIPDTENVESSKATRRSTEMERSTTKIDPGTERQEEGRGSTLFEKSAEEPRRSRSAPHNRRITGVVVTFSWRYEGELFVLYEGRNVIGSGPSCDVQITTDPIMSGEHAVILCRAGRDELHDLLSTNGTFLNEKYVERDGADLTDGAIIKTGRSLFEFRKITSERAPEGYRPAEDFERGDPRPRSSGETAI